MKKIYALLILLFFFLPLVGFAQLEYTPLEPISGVNQTGEVGSFGNVLSYAFRVIFTIAALIALVTLTLSGITYMMSEVVDKKHEARERIRAAFMGLGLLLGAWLILYTINPQLLEFTFFAPNTATPNIPSTSPTSQGAEWREFKNDAEYLKVGEDFGCPTRALSGLPDGCIARTVLVYDSAVTGTTAEVMKISDNIAAAKARFTAYCENGSAWDLRVWRVRTKPASSIGDTRSNKEMMYCLNIYAF